MSRPIQKHEKRTIKDSKKELAGLQHQIRRRAADLRGMPDTPSNGYFSTFFLTFAVFGLD
jgi:hypothetical protein